MNWFYIKFYLIVITFINFKECEYFFSKSLNIMNNLHSNFVTIK